MSNDREFNASSVEEAVETAAYELGLTQERLSYQIMDEGSSGFLGLGARDARILVSSPESAEVQAQVEPGEDREDRSSSARTELDVAQTSASDELLASVREHVHKILSFSGLGGEASVKDEEEFILVEIESPESGLLIGQKGETIDSLQYLVNVAIYRERAFEKKIVLDVGGYRERRVKAVQGMALRAAKRVSKEGKAVDLPPMSASERRAVHTYLKDDPRVTTSSNGTKEDRRITILPA